MMNIEQLLERLDTAETDEAAFPPPFPFRQLHQSGGRNFGLSANGLLFSQTI